MKKTNYLLIEGTKVLSISSTKLIIKIMGFLIFGIAVGCAVRDKPAPIVHATAVPPSLSQPQPIANVVEKPTVVTSKSKITAIEENDNDVQEATAPNKQKSEDQLGSSSDNTSVGNGWIMPTKGDVTQKFKQNGKGINISGTEGQTINAIGDGKVLYSGSGLKGYGNLIIIKHDATYLSAYAHNKINLVKQGASVKSGQKIAEMGKSNAKKAELHFEIRKNGKPIDPLTVINSNYR